MSEHVATSAAPSPAPAAAWIARLSGALDRALEAVTGTLLAATVVIALTQVFWRYVLNDSLSWPEEMARWAFVWLVFLGSAMLTRRGGHITIDLLPRVLGIRALRLHAVIVRAAVATSTLALLLYGGDLVARASYVSPVLGWHFMYLYLAVPTGA